MFISDYDSEEQKASKNYQLAVAQALAGFQLIEAQLKDYISTYYEMVYHILPEGMIFNYSEQDIKDLALGGLVKLFSKFNSNQELITKLRQLQTDRDRLAHRALVQLYDNNVLNGDFELQSSQLLALAGQLGSILKELNDEQGKLILIMGKI